MHGEFHEIIGRVRRNKGITQRQAATDLGASQARFSHYERGIREPDLAFLARLCDYYDISADVLLGRAPYIVPDHQVNV